MAFNLDTRWLLNKTDYSDVTIKFSGKEMRWHKVVLCSGSEYYKKLCGPGSQFSESKQDVIELKDDHPDAVVAMLRFLYTGKIYEEGDPIWHPWRFYFDVMRCADKHHITALYNCAFPLFHKVTTQKLEAKDVYCAITSLREELPIPGCLALADKLEYQHFRGLVQIPAYFQTLGPEHMEWFFEEQEAKKEDPQIGDLYLSLCNSCGSTRIDKDLRDVNGNYRPCEDNPQYGNMIGWHVLKDRKALARHLEKKLVQTHNWDW